MIVCCWVAELGVPPVTEAVMVGEPALVSVYAKLALEVASAIATVVMVAVLAVLRSVPPAEVVARLTVSAPAVTGLEYWSRRCTVIVPDSTPAVTVCGLVVKTSRLATAGLMVSCWVAEAGVPPVTEAVMVGEPALVSVYAKLALEVVSAIATVVMVAVLAVLRSVPPAEVVARFTVSAPAVTGLSYASRRCTVMVPDSTPVVSVWGLVGYTSWVADPTFMTTLPDAPVSTSPERVAIRVYVPAAPEPVILQPLKVATPLTAVTVRFPAFVHERRPVAGPASMASVTLPLSVVTTLFALSLTFTTGEVAKFAPSVTLPTGWVVNTSLFPVPGVMTTLPDAPVEVSGTELRVAVATRV